MHAPRLPSHRRWRHCSLRNWARTPHGSKPRSLRFELSRLNIFRRAANIRPILRISVTQNRLHASPRSMLLDNVWAPIYGFDAACFSLETNSKSANFGIASMSLKNASAVCLLILSALALNAQAPPPTPAAKPAPDVVAGIPVNYDEAKVGTYTLTDPLKLNDGKPVRDAKTWYAKRRPEIVAMFETQQYGRAPGRPAEESFEVSDKGTPALNGKAIRKQVTIYLSK